MADRYIPLTTATSPQQSGRYVQITPQLAAQIQSRSGGGLAPTQQSAPQPSALYNTLQGVRQTLGSVQPFVNMMGSPVASGAVGALGGGAQIGAALTNPYATDAQQALQAFGGALQSGQSVGTMAGSQLANQAGRYVPYVGTALALGGILAGNAPEHAKYGQATQALGTLAAQQVASGVVGGAGAATSGAAAAGGTALGAGLSSALFGGILGLYAYGLGELVSHLTKSDYHSKRQKEAGRFSRWVEPFAENVIGAQTEQELEDALAQSGMYGTGKQYSWDRGLQGFRHLGPKEGFNPAQIETDLSSLIERQRSIIRAAGTGDPQALDILKTGRQRLEEYRDVTNLFNPGTYGISAGQWTPERGFEGLQALKDSPYADNMRSTIYDLIMYRKPWSDNRERYMQIAQRYGLDISQPQPTSVTDPYHMASASA